MKQRRLFLVTSMHVIFSLTISTQNNGVTSFDYTLKNTIEMANLRQIITEPTRTNSNSENLRDLILTNYNTVVESGTLSSFPQLDHFPVYVSVDLTIPKEKQDPKYTNIWGYSKMDAPLLTSLLDTDCESILNNDIDSDRTVRFSIARSCYRFNTS